MFKKITKAVQQLRTQPREYKSHTTYTPAYRLLEILQDEDGEYTVSIQIINKSIVFSATPEEILAQDSLVDLFSPRDIRALTYIGYLSVNNPKYKILAQKLSQDSDKILFAIKKRGDKKVIVKTADEILREKEILDNMNAKDAHTVGYVVGNQTV